MRRLLCWVKGHDWRLLGMGRYGDYSEYCERCGARRWGEKKEER